MDILYMKHIHISHILFKLTKKYDIIGKKELYVVICNETYNYKFHLNSRDDNIWEYCKTIYIPFCNIITLTIYDNDIVYDDIIQKTEFNIGDIKSKDNLTIEYKIVEIIDSKMYHDENSKLLSQINNLSIQNNQQIEIKKTLKDKVKDLTACIRIYEIKIQDLEKINTELTNLKDEIKNLIIR